MRRDDHEIEPLFAGLGRHQADGGGTERPRRPRDPTLKWKLVGVAAFLVLLFVLIRHQAF
jgi:hypothetical protein